MLLLLSSVTFANSKNCEVPRPIKIAGLDWESNNLLAKISTLILEKGYDCKVETIPGSSIPLITGMARGDIDIMVEVWAENVKIIWSKYVKEGKVTQLGTSFNGAVQGFFVPRYLVEGDVKKGKKALAPELRSVFDLPKYKHLFKDKEEPQKGRFYNCVFGWTCEVVNSHKLRIYGLQEHFTNFRPGTSAALDATISAHYKRKKPFVAYYWGPTWILGQYDLVILEEPSYVKQVFETLTDDKAKPKKAVAYPKIDVLTAANTRFARQYPKTSDFFTKFNIPVDLINKMLGQMKRDRIETEGMAKRFLKEHKAIWTKWVPNHINQKVSKYF